MTAHSRFVATLESSLEKTANWNVETNSWDIKDRPNYRWVDHKGRAVSTWYGDLTQALEWIKQYDIQQSQTTQGRR
jgi:hypothetical protein